MVFSSASPAACYKAENDSIEGKAWTDAEWERKKEKVFIEK